MHWIALQPQPEPFGAEDGAGAGAGSGSGASDVLATESASAAAKRGLSGRKKAPAGDWVNDPASGLTNDPVNGLADGLIALGWWALQFTPKVAQVAVDDGDKGAGSDIKSNVKSNAKREGKSVLVLEVSASERLFGGRQQLLAHIYRSNKPFSHVLYAQAATSLIAIAKLQISPRVLSASAAFAPAPASASPRVAANALAGRNPRDQRDNPPARLPHTPPHSLLDSPPGSAPARQPDNLPDSLPLTTLAAAHAHLPTLARMGCTTWGQLRALPRGGVVRRFGAELLDALDRAYGDKPELYPWLVLPEVLDVTLELQAQVETAPALMFSARRLLAQMQVWLQMRQCGVLAFELGWTMDARRNTATTGALAVRTAEPTRDMAHLQRLLAEHLARLTLPAPVLYLHLRTLQVEKLGAGTASLLLEDLRSGDSLHQLLERLSARLGAHQVLQLQARADHRPECMQTWQPASKISDISKLIANYSIRTSEKGKNSPKTHVEGQIQAQNQVPCQVSHQVPHQVQNQNTAPIQTRLQSQTLQADALYPTWLLAPPLKLPVRHNAPQCPQGGPLTLLAGPQRVEAGWWTGQKNGESEGRGQRGERGGAGGDASHPASASTSPSPSASASAPCALRDYFLARSDRMGLLWIYRERLGGQGAQSGAGQPAPSRADSGADQKADGSGWYLHGLFA